MSSRLPSDALRSRTSPVKVLIIAIAAVVLVGGLGAATFAFGPSLRARLDHPTVSVTVAPADTTPTLSPDELGSIQQAADAQQAQIAADRAAAAQAAAEAAAAQAAAAKKTRTTHRWVVGGALPPSQSVASGQPVPFVYDPNPQDAGGGYYDTNACVSSSGSTINGVPVCD